jgi:transposase
MAWCIDMGGEMTYYVGLGVSQKTTSICVIDASGCRVWRGVCATSPERIEQTVRRYAGDDACIGVETGPMTPWLVHELRGRDLMVVCIDARHARAALRMQLNKTDQNDAEELAQIVRTTGWYRSVHVKSLEARGTHRQQAPQIAVTLFGHTAHLVLATTRVLSWDQPDPCREFAA